MEAYHTYHPNISNKDFRQRRSVSFMDEKTEPNRKSVRLNDAQVTSSSSSSNDFHAQGVSSKDWADTAVTGPSSKGRSHRIKLHYNTEDSAEDSQHIPSSYDERLGRILLASPSQQPGPKSHSTSRESGEHGTHRSTAPVSLTTADRLSLQQRYLHQYFSTPGPIPRSSTNKKSLKKADDAGFQQDNDQFDTSEESGIRPSPSASPNAAVHTRPTIRRVNSKRSSHSQDSGVDMTFDRPRNDDVDAAKEAEQHPTLAKGEELTITLSPPRQHVRPVERKPQLRQPKDPPPSLASEQPSTQRRSWVETEPVIPFKNTEAFKIPLRRCKELNNAGPPRRSPRKPPKCRFCPQSLGKDLSQARLHLVRHFLEFQGKHQCTTCQIGFIHSRDLRLHLRSAAAATPHCGFKFEHNSPCTGHHQPHETNLKQRFSDRFKLCYALKYFDMAVVQLQLDYINNISTLPPGSLASKRNTWASSYGTSSSSSTSGGEDFLGKTSALLCY